MLFLKLFIFAAVVSDSNVFYNVYCAFIVVIDSYYVDSFDIVSVFDGVYFTSVAIFFLSLVDLFPFSLVPMCYFRSGLSVVLISLILMVLDFLLKTSFLKFMLTLIPLMFMLMLLFLLLIFSISD